MTGYWGWVQAFTDRLEPIEASVAPALRAPVAYGPRIVAGDAPAAITARLYRPDALSAPVVTFDAPMARQWQDKLNDVGMGSMELMNDDPQLDEVADGDVIRFELYGEAALVWEVAERSRAAIAEGEEAAQTTKLAGPSHLAVLSRSLVYPKRSPVIDPQVASRAIEGVPVEEDRIFGWVSPEYDDAAWVAPVSQGTVTEAATHGARWTPTWPHQAGAWLWSSHAVPHLWAPGGKVYFRKTFTTTHPMIAIYAVGDDRMQVYLDGGLVIARAEWTNTGADIQNAKVPVAAGEHLLAIEASNWGTETTRPPGGFNPAGLVVAVYELDDYGRFQTFMEHPLVATDTTWKCLPYPAAAPGMTPGHVLTQVIAEVNQRRGTPAITCAFDRYVDSAGNPWTQIGEFGTKVGTDLLTFLREMAATYVDFWMAPASYELHAWNKDARGHARSVVLRAPTDPSDPTSGNLAALSQQRVA